MRKELTERAVLTLLRSGARIWSGVEGCGELPAETTPVRAELVDRKCLSTAGAEQDMHAFGVTPLNRLIVMFV